MPGTPPLEFCEGSSYLYIPLHYQERKEAFLSSRKNNKMLTTELPILAHLLVESVAALSFLSQPHIQLQNPKPSEEAVLICHSYAGSLISTNVLCALFLARRNSKIFDSASSFLSVSLAVYHVFPMRRAWARIKKRRGKYKPEERMAGGPPGHLMIHAALFGSLIWAGLYETWL